MKSYTITLQDKQQVANETMAFYFDKPAEFTFKAGQYCRWTLLNPPDSDAEGNARNFSLASAPHEDFLMFSTRMRDTAFKRVLRAITPGSQIQIKGPMGELTLHDDVTTPAVLLAGGIGITPFRSILLDAAHNMLPHKILVLYSSRRPEDAPFLDSLQNLQNPNYDFVGIMTQMSKSTQSWDGETGHVNKEMLVKYIDDLTKPIYYVAGPAAMLQSLEQALFDAGADKSRIRTEEFDGY